MILLLFFGTVAVAASPLSPVDDFATAVGVPSYADYLSSSYAYAYSFMHSFIYSTAAVVNSPPVVPPALTIGQTGATTTQPIFVQGKSPLID